jgi:hypothetical protein
VCEDRAMKPDRATMLASFARALARGTRFFDLRSNLPLTTPQAVFRAIKRDGEIVVEPTKDDPVFYDEERQ